MGSSIGEMLPLYQSHKRVHAARILEVGNDDRMMLEPPAGSAVLSVSPSDRMFARYRPVPGDYYVVYDDGYAAISPRAAFESGYTLVEPGA